MDRPPKSSLADSVIVAAVRLTRWLKAADPSPELTPAQASALAAVVWSGGLRPSDLAQLERVSRPVVARTLGELEARGLVERTPGAADGRTVRVQATLAGRRLLAKGQSRRAAPLVEALGRLPQRDQAVVAEAADIIDRLVDEAISADAQAALMPDGGGPGKAE
jgi:DNA-binding MarR family transcriptional regulator